MCVYVLGFLIDFDNGLFLLFLDIDLFYKHTKLN